MVRIITRLWQVIDAKSVRAGLFIGGVSVLLLLVWLVFGKQPLCEWLIYADMHVSQHILIACLVLFAWSFCLFMTVLPLGTATIVLAGYLIGPIAGIVQFLALLGSSIVLFELSRDQSETALEKRLLPWPKLANWAGLARRNGLGFSAFLRLVPVVPSAVAGLVAAYFHISRRDFVVGTVLVGWVRPVGFSMLGTLGKFAPLCGYGSVI